MADVTVKHRFIHQAPRKLRLVGDSVRGIPAARAVAELAAISQKASQVIRKLVLAGIAAAKEQNLATGSLFVTAIQVDEGPKLRRFVTQSRGRSQRILKRMSHVTLTLSDEPVVIASGKAYKAELSQPSQAKKSKTVKKSETVEPTEQPQTEPVVAQSESTEGSDHGSKS